MATGIWTAASGAIAQAQHLEVVANNLANVDTTAFKKDIATFKEYMVNQERDQTEMDIPRSPIKDKDFYPLDGKDQSFVTVDGTHTIYEPGNLRVTQKQWDLAIEGPAFFEVNTPKGIRFTREGSLKIAPDGRLVTQEGYPVLAAATTPNREVQPGADIANRFIQLRDQGPTFSLAENGEIYANGDLVAKMSVVEFQDLKKIKKVGGQYFENKDPANITAANQSSVRQGMIETSNVNPVQEMTNLIKANRLFEHDIKALKTYGEILGREANDIGKL